jgi:hypothetical protein
MSGFDEAWNAISRQRDDEKVSPQLRPLLKSAYLQSLARPLDRASFKRSLKDLLKFLATEGRTNANCWAVDLFFANSQGWERDWAEQNLPEDFHEILALMGEALHDTVKDSEVAMNFGCSPEQLLERVERLSDN